MQTTTVSLEDLKELREWAENNGPMLLGEGYRIHTEWKQALATIDALIAAHPDNTKEEGK